jgi:hypothetical protein
MADTDVLRPFVPASYPKFEAGVQQYLAGEFTKLAQSVKIIIQTMVVRETRTAQPVSTYANRPSSPLEGDWAIITDSNTAVWGATVAAGGANRVLARYNNAGNWTVVAL